MLIRVVLIFFLLGLLLVGFIFQKNLEDFLFWREMTKNPQLLASQVNQQILEEKLKNLKPLRNWQVEELKIKAKSAISVLLNDEGRQRILFEKNSNKILPIASLTKLMTANIVLENYDLSREIQISEKAVTQEGETGKLKAGKIFPTKYLLYPLLIESSNGAAFSLVNDYNEMGEEKFVELMNLKAKELGLKNTNFVNFTGLDPQTKFGLEEPNRTLNSSTAEDLVKLTQYLLKKPLIWEILSTQKFNRYEAELINTNKLLKEIPGVIGGKTGYTEKAGGCMLLVLKAPKNQGLLINIILGSGDRFGEMEKLVNWVNIAYKW